MPSLVEYWPHGSREEKFKFLLKLSCLSRNNLRGGELLFEKENRGFCYSNLDSSLDHPDLSSLDEQSRGLFGYSLAVFRESDLVLTFIKAFPDSGKTSKSKPARFEVQCVSLHDVCRVFRIL